MPYADRDRQRRFQRDNIANKNLVRRIIVIEFLGGQCVRCGEDDYKCLQIDHIKPILRVKNKVYPGQKVVLDTYMDRECIENLQILCANCHMRKTYQEDKLLYSTYIG